MGNKINDDESIIKDSAHNIDKAEKALDEADETILSLALTTKLFANKLRKLVKPDKDIIDHGNPANLSELPLHPVDLAKLLVAVTDSAIKLGKRAEEVHYRNRKKITSITKSALDTRIQQITSKLPIKADIGHNDIIVRSTNSSKDFDYDD